jgi:ABC-type uncharacterized transport system permease subunit
MTSGAQVPPRRRRTTRRAVRVAEGVARSLITVGGIGTIAAVSLIFVFLVYVVVPLWAPAELHAAGDAAAAPGQPWATGVDEDRMLRFELDRSGLLRAVRADDGSALAEFEGLRRGPDLAPSAVQLLPDRRQFAAGYPDGRLVLGQIDFRSTVFVDLAESASEADLAAEAGAGEDEGEDGAAAAGGDGDERRPPAARVQVRPLPAALRGLAEGERREFEGGVVRRISPRKSSHVTLALETLAPLDFFPGVPVHALDSSGTLAFEQGEDPEVELVVAAVSASGALRVAQLELTVDLLSGDSQLETRGDLVADVSRADLGLPEHLFLSGLGDHLLLVWADGTAQHFEFRDGRLQRRDDVDLLAQASPGARITAVAPLLGKTSLIVGDSDGTLAAWFPARPDTAAEQEQRELAVREYQTTLYALRDLLEGAGLPAHRLPYSGIESTGLSAEDLAGLRPEVRERAEQLLARLTPAAAAAAQARLALIAADRQRFFCGQRIAGPRPGHPTALGVSPRTRTLAVGTSEGAVGLVHVTSGRLLATHSVGPEAVTGVTLTPKEDAVYARSGGRVATLEADPGHPEVSVATLFAPVWYEGESGPRHIWQSTGGSDAFEPKIGLLPLVFGTIKATIYSMIFGAPLALLAAIYSSEFLKPGLRSTLKGILELMASLPSVVLGFLAALVIAPYVQEVLPGLLAFFIVLPFTLVMGANLWQLMPRRRAILWSGWQRFACIALALPTSVLIASWVGPLVEAAFFSGNIDLWLDGQLGDGTGGWLLLFLPLSALVVMLALSRWVDPWLRNLASSFDHGQTTRAELLKFTLAGLAALGLAIVAAQVVGGLGFDPRGGLVDTYVQRNALVVGFVMGFAVIPIIYTLAEDALSSVPGHLRLASLGCGATPWQTAVRVIVPTAMSGLFSAVMIGLGRAVGETMIVLMAAGNTPVLDWNVFNGFRTLSANIAVELPEAARGTTHYRVLFLAALTLFAMTFVLNTLAEVVRSRFRRRAFQL